MKRLYAITYVSYAGYPVTVRVQESNPEEAVKRVKEQYNPYRIKSVRELKRRGVTP